ncbi:MAG: hypothetical protein JW955_03135 [Sedimentisphaerales bacterium]|nr:hypothetical protein [Sedimentisphaerales bacterium]
MRRLTREDVACLCLSVLLVLTVGAANPSGRERARRTVCLVNLQQLTRAWNLYADDNAGKIVNGDTQEYTAMYMPGLSPAKSHYRKPPWVTMDWNNGATIQQKKVAIMAGALFAYVRDVRFYRCTLGGPTATRGYSIVDVMNCKGWDPGGIMVKNRGEIEQPESRFVLIDHGGNAVTLMGGWTCFVREDRWWDPPPVHHGAGTSFSFADGHMEYWKWNDPRTVEFGKQGASLSPQQSGNVDIRRTSLAAWGRPPSVPNRNTR